MDRVFLDANVLFSAAYRPDAGLRRLWGLTDVELVTSPYAVAEAHRNLDTAQQRGALQTLLDSVTVLAVLPDLPPLPPAVALPEKDRPILAAALHVKATHLLTGDSKDFGHYYGQIVGGVLILRPATYLRQRQHGS